MLCCALKCESAYCNILLVSILSTINAPVDIKVGDQVRVKPSITTPKPNWGADVTHKSVGVVKVKISFSSNKFSVITSNLHSSTSFKICTCSLFRH